jgi:hypothetical protein
MIRQVLFAAGKQFCRLQRLPRLAGVNAINQVKPHAPAPMLTVGLAESLRLGNPM